ncbi:MAG: alpha/beta hydrolase [Pseudomonadota bacterium]
MARILVIIAAVLLLLAGWSYIRQPAMIFFPSRTLVATPSDWELSYEDVEIVSEDGVELHGWYLPHEASSRTLLLLHGNAGNISHRGDSLRIFHSLGLNVFIIDYRGYGRSKGAPDEKGFYRDARAAWEYLINVRNRSPDRVVIFGRSLGGAVAARLASEVQPGGLILESSISSVRDMAENMHPLLPYLNYIRYDFDAAGALRNVYSPVLILHSPQDEIIPFELGLKLYEAANEPKFFEPLQGDHNNGFMESQPLYELALLHFLYGMVYRDHGGKKIMAGQ